MKKSLLLLQIVCLAKSLVTMVSGFSVALPGLSKSVSLIASILTMLSPPTIRERSVASLRLAVSSKAFWLCLDF